MRVCAFFWALIAKEVQVHRIELKWASVGGFVSWVLIMTKAFYLVAAAGFLFNPPSASNLNGQATPMR